MLKWIRISSLAMVMMFASNVAMAEHPAQDVVETAINSMMKFLDEKQADIKKDPAILDAKVDELFIEHIDFQSMTKLIMGKNWKKASAEQRTDLVHELQQMLLLTYTQALVEYGGETMEFDKFRAEKRDDRAVVRSTFVQNGGTKTPVIYKLRKNDTWQIYDIVVKDLSLVTSYRPAFASEIERGGIAGLLETLRKNNGKS